MYFYYKRRGYPEEKCITIAVKYMWGVIGSSSVLTNEKMREIHLFT